MTERQCRNCQKDMTGFHPAEVYCGRDCKIKYKNTQHNLAWINAKPRPKPNRHQVFTGRPKNNGS